jgi:ribonuclease-3
VFQWAKEKIRLFCHQGKEPYLSIYSITGFCPKDIRVYEQAFLHKSSCNYNEGRRLNNERLEFLGDAVLGVIVADILYKRFPSKREGFLTDSRSKIVQRETLNRVAVELGIDKLLHYSGRPHHSTAHNTYICGNALEALIAAVYLDRGYRACYRFIDTVIIRKYIHLDSIVRKEVNFKSNLIEWGQKNKVEVVFNLAESVTARNGDITFRTVVLLGGIEAGDGWGYTKKESQQKSAKVAVKKLHTDKEFHRSLFDSVREVTPTQELPQE